MSCSSRLLSKRQKLSTVQNFSWFATDIFSTYLQQIKEFSQILHQLFSDQLGQPAYRQCKCALTNDISHLCSKYVNFFNPRKFRRKTLISLFQALDMFWHEDCLKCGCCDCRLGEVGSTLYTKANLILCKRDYLRLVPWQITCKIVCLILGFRRSVNHIFTLLLYYVTQIGTQLPAFRDNLSV